MVYLCNNIFNIYILKVKFKKRINKSLDKNYYNLADLPLIDCIDFHNQLKDGLFGEFKDQALQLHTKGFCTFEVKNKNWLEIIDKLRDELSESQEFKKTLKNKISLRFQDAWLHKKSALVKKLATEKSILKFLSTLYGRKPFPFQTLNFPYGSKQHFHSDAVHFHSIPEGFMCGVWIALEDVHEDAGPLIYYPESHRLPYISSKTMGITLEEINNCSTPQKYFERYWIDIVKENGFKKEKFLAKKGDLLLWHANLLHGGDIIKNKNLTRWSQVTHYFFENCGFMTPFFNTIDKNQRKWRNPLNLLNE